MSVKPRTIDNLGVDSSIRYAKDQQIFDSKIIEESRFVAAKSEVTVSTPYQAIQLPEYLSPEKNILWATFSHPPEFAGSTKALFSYQLIPSLGGFEKQDANLDKLLAIEDTLKKAYKDQKREDSQEQKEEKERKILVQFFKTIQKLDRALHLINARRNQYQRG